MAVHEPASDVQPCVLVIDDDEISLGVIAMILEAEGCRVLQAADGEQALKLAAEAPEGAEPSVVLADLQMPGLCGRELALALRTLLPRALLVAMSATPSPPEGYNSFVAKPLDFAALRCLIENPPLEDLSPGADMYAAGNDEIPDLDDRIYRKLQHAMPPSALAEVYAACLTDTRNRALQMLEPDEQDSEFASIRRSAHTIKGGAGMIGAAMLAKAAARLELGSYMRDDVPGLINNLLLTCDRLQSILLSKSSTEG